MSLPRTLPAKAPLLAAARPRAGLRLCCEAALWRHGLWPVLALLLLAAAAWMWVVERPAAEQALAVPMPRLAAGAGRTALAAAVSDEAGDAQRLAILRNTLLPQADTTVLVQRLVELTRQDLAWRQAEFQHSEDKPLNLLRTQITVPVAGTYPRLRQALDLALCELPNLSIDQVLLQRQSSGESMLNARVRLSFWLNMPVSVARPALPPPIVDAGAPAAAATAGNAPPVPAPGASAPAGTARANGAGLPATPPSAAPMLSPGGRR